MRTTDSPSPRSGTIRAAAVALFAFVGAITPVDPAVSAADAGATAEVVPVPDVLGPLPDNAASYPFNKAIRTLTPVDITPFGYVEEEYFLSGLANVYEWAVEFETVQVRTPDAPYTNRILVRRPADPTKFSGTVIVELLNLTGQLGYENPYIWGDSWQYMLERGHVWIGVTSTPGALEPLKTFDPVRYAPLSWDDPLPPEERCVPDRETEAGLLWDILSQVAALVKSDDPASPLQAYDVERAYATMQVGGGGPLYTNTIGPIAETADGEPVYDGYVIKASGSHAGQINQCEEAPPATHPIASSRSPQPVIRVHSHSDVIRGSDIHPGTTCDIRREDSDHVLPYRHYEIAGAHVAAQYQVLHSVPAREDQERSGGLVIPPGVVAMPPHEFPTRYILNGAFDNMDQWVRDGIAPPRATFLEEANEDCTDLIVDEFGTPRGGVRTPYVDVPVATYPAHVILVPGGRPLGHPIPFDEELVRELYRNHGNYVRQVVHQTNDLVKDRWVTREDGRKIKSEAAHFELLKGRGSGPPSG